jgi:hypothetical protein
VLINKYLKDCKETEKNYKKTVYSTKEARMDYIKCLEDSPEKYQITEENCIESIKTIILTGLDIKEEVEILEKIEVSKEIEEIIKRLDLRSKKVEEIKYVKVPCNSEAILQKFDNHYSKGGEAGLFDFESARQAVISGIEIGVDKEVQELKKILQKVLCACWENEPNFSSTEQQ